MNVKSIAVKVLKAERLRSLLVIDEFMFVRPGILEGARAAECGDPPETNPHQPGTDIYSCWEHGYNEVIYRLELDLVGIG